CIMHGLPPNQITAENAKKIGALFAGLVEYDYGDVSGTDVLCSNGYMRLKVDVWDDEPLWEGCYKRKPNDIYEGLMKQSKRKLGYGRIQEGIHEANYKVKNFQRAAKGVYGGQDAIRPRSPNSKKSGAPSLLLKSSSLSTIIRHAGVGLLLVAFL
ncbi:hypothetical protein Tsubulata_029253, partial [Turnera subulata]